MNGYVSAMRRYFEFGGRSSRSEFWFFVLGVVILSILASIIDLQLFGASASGVSILSSLVSLVHVIPGISVQVRRLHDIDRSGWWVLLGILPSMVFAAATIAWLAGGGDPGQVSLAQVGVGLAVFGLLEIAIAIVLLVFYCSRGTAGPNRFGPAPAI